MTTAVEVEIPAGGLTYGDRIVDVGDVLDVDLSPNPRYMLVLIAGQGHDGQDDRWRIYRRDEPVMVVVED